MSILVLLINLGFVLSPVAGFLLYRQFHKWKVEERLLVASLPSAALLVLQLFLGRVASAPFLLWNDARLAPIFALVRGYQLYYPSNSGPILNHIYGPLSPLVYFPATWSNSVTLALIIAALISTLFSFLPILYLHLHDTKHSLRYFVFSSLSFCCFFLLATQTSSLDYSTFLIHADAPAIGFSAIAVGLIYLRRHPERQRLLILSAIFAVLAVWTKQTTVSVGVAMAVYILLTEGRRNFWRFCLYYLLAALAISALLLLLFKPQELIFNAVIIPSRHPWIISNRLLALIRVYQELLNNSSLLLFSLLASILFSLVAPAQAAQNSLNSHRQWLAQHRWSVFLWASLFLSLPSVMTRVKVGGDINAFSLTIYFLAAGVLLSFKDLYRSATLDQEFYPDVGDKVSHVSRALQHRASTIYLLTLALMLCFSQFGFGINMLKTVKTVPNNSAIAYAFIKKYPGKVYFPFNPLAHLMAENKPYHFAYGIFDRQLGGFPPNPEHFRQHIPPDVEWILSPTPQSIENVLAYLPEFRPVNGFPLDDWLVFSRHGELPQFPDHLGNLPGTAR